MARSVRFLLTAGAKLIPALLPVILTLFPDTQSADGHPAQPIENKSLQFT
jgi:hypothetical protein